jgi:hypothetical protein
MTPKRAFSRSLLLLPLAVLFAHEVRAENTAGRQFSGTWTLTFVDNVSPNGSRVQLYGPHPHGITTFDGEGRYSLQIMSDGRPKFAANDKSKGTPEEYKAAIQGINCHFGRYSVNEGSQAITLRVEHATYPNWEGIELILPFKIAGDQLVLTIPRPATGGPGTIGEVGLKRVQ